MKPTDTIRCERLHCTLSAGACVRRQEAFYGGDNTGPMHLPCGIALAVKHGRTGIENGLGRGLTEEEEARALGPPCQQGLAIAAALGMSPAPKAERHFEANVRAARYREIVRRLNLECLPHREVA